MFLCSPATTFAQAFSKRPSTSLLSMMAPADISRWLMSVVGAGADSHFFDLPSFFTSERSVLTCTPRKSAGCLYI